MKKVTKIEATLLKYLFFLLIISISIFLLPLENIIYKGNSTTLKTSSYIVKNKKIEISNDPLSESELVTDLLDNTIPITDIIGDSTLYFRFSESGCNPCINEQVKYLKLINQAGLYRIVVLVNCRTLRNLQILINSHELNFEVYMLNQVENWGEPGLSYYFTLNGESYKKENFFYISSKNPQSSLKYFVKVLPRTQKLFVNN